MPFIIFNLVLQGKSPWVVNKHLTLCVTKTDIIISSSKPFRNLRVILRSPSLTLIPYFEPEAKFYTSWPSLAFLPTQSSCNALVYVPHPTPSLTELQQLVSTLFLSSIFPTPIHLPPDHTRHLLGTQISTSLHCLNPSGVLYYLQSIVRDHSMELSIL